MPAIDTACERHCDSEFHSNGQNASEMLPSVKANYNMLQAVKTHRSTKNARHAQ